MRTGPTRSETGAGNRYRTRCERAGVGRAVGNGRAGRRRSGRHGSEQYPAGVVIGVAEGVGRVRRVRWCGCRGGDPASLVVEDTNLRSAFLAGWPLGEFVVHPTEYEHSTDPCHTDGHPNRRVRDQPVTEVVARTASPSSTATRTGRFRTPSLHAANVTLPWLSPTSESGSR
jgi:hypothetical protein